MIVLDTSAWVEYFVGSAKGQQVDSILKSAETITTPVIVLIELCCKARKENVDFSPQVDFIKQHSIIQAIDEELIFEVAKNYVEIRKRTMKASVADAMILTVAKNLGASLVTCDYDFRELENVRII